MRAALTANHPNCPSRPWRPPANAFEARGFTRVAAAGLLAIGCAATLSGFARSANRAPSRNAWAAGLGGSAASTSGEPSQLAADSLRDRLGRIAFATGERLPETAVAAIPMDQRGDTGTGLSGALRVHLLSPGSAPAGTYQLPEGVAGRSFAFLGVLPFSSKRGEWVDRYRVGWWPAELHRVTSGAYDNPGGFVRVNAEDVDLPVSTHFRLGDFITRDAQPFPRYVVLRESLLDKLELVLADLARHGIPTQNVVVLSGFRTPAHNFALGDASGRARESRHQYGDAADVIIDSDRDGRMDDLDGDGRVDAADVRVIEAAVNRVELSHPELAGGLGLYEAMGPSGPFAHIDVRGTRARWGTLGRATGTYASGGYAGSASVHETATGHCYAEGESAILCQGFRHGH